MNRWEFPGEAPGFVRALPGRGGRHGSVCGDCIDRRRGVGGLHVRGRFCGSYFRPGRAFGAAPAARADGRRAGCGRCAARAGWIRAVPPGAGVAAAGASRNGARAAGGHVRAAARRICGGRASAVGGARQGCAGIAAPGKPRASGGKAAQGARSAFVAGRAGPPGNGLPCAGGRTRMARWALPQRADVAAVSGGGPQLWHGRPRGRARNPLCHRRGVAHGRD